MTSRKELTMREATTKFKDFIRGKNSNNKATSTDKNGNITEFNIKNAELLYANTTYIDEATKSCLYMWFMNRVLNTEEQDEVCLGFDSDGIPSEYFPNLDFGKFIGFFNRTLLNDEYRYKELLRIERTQFDPMIADYLEAWSKDTHDDSKTSQTSGSDTPSVVNETTTVNGSGTKSNSGSDLKTTEYGKNTGVDVTITNNLSDARTLNLANSSTTEDESLTPSTDTTTYNNLTETDESKQASMAKNLPNSISYPGATAGSLPSLNWGTGSGQNQAEGENSHVTSGSVDVSHEHDNRVSTSGTNTGTDTLARTGTINTQGDLLTTSGSDTVSATSSTQETTSDTKTSEVTKTAVSGSNNSETSESNSGNDEHKEIRSGRSNILPQEAMPKAINYIKNSRAFDWLKDELDTCFLQIL